jgi:hypothetical protein
MKTSSREKIKGKITVKIFKDNSLKNKSILEGFVYSRHDGMFIEFANISIDKELKIGTTSNKDGFFQSEINAGTYSIECSSVGHTTEKLKEIKVENGQRLLIIFELGTVMTN